MVQTWLCQTETTSHPEEIFFLISKCVLLFFLFVTYDIKDGIFKLEEQRFFIRSI